MLKNLKKKVHEKISLPSVFMKIFFFNLAVTVCITLVFQGVVYWVIDKNYIEKYEQVSSHHMENIFNHIEKNIIQRTTKIPEYYFSNIDRNKGTNYPIKNQLANNSKAIYNLTDRLDEIFSNYEFITSLDIYYPETNSVVTDFRNIYYIESEQQLYKYVPWINTYNKSNKQVMLIEENILNYPQKQRALTYAVGLPLREKANMILGIHIDVDAFQSYLDNMTGDFIIADDEGDILYQYGEEEFAQEVRELVKLLDEKIFKEGKAEIDHKGMDMIFSYKYSESLDIIYMCFVPKEVFYEEYNIFKMMVKIIFSGFILISFIGGYIISKRTNKTYSKEVAVVGSSLDIEESNFDVAISQIMDKIFDLNRQVEVGNQAKLSNEIRNIVNGSITKDTQMIIEKQITYKHIYGCIIKTKTRMKELNEIELMNEINQAEKDFKTIFIKNKKNEILILVNYNQETYKNTVSWMQKFIKKIYLGDAVVAIGKSYEGGISGIADSFNEASLALDYHYIWPEQKWLIHAEISQRQFKTTKNHLKIFLQIENGIRGNDFEQVRLKIEQLMVAFESGYYDSYYCKATLRDLVTYIHHLSEGYEIDNVQIYGYDIREYFSDIENIYQFKYWILDICSSLMESIIKNKQDIGEQIEERIIAIIGSNLENDISLEFVADKMNMRPDTLSKLFKTVMGKNYSEYIKEKKLEYAVELLKIKKYSIKEIAEKLGYSSTQYFIKIFKDEFGETPKQYQKQYSIKE